MRRFAEELQSLPPEQLGGSMRELLVFPPRAARYAPIDLPEVLAPILERRGIRALYHHQAEALRAWRNGEDVLVTTDTASGKSLVYTLALAERALGRRNTRALFLFPLKALEQDQLRALRADLASLPLLDGPTADIYDGDTSPHRRKQLRDSPPNALFTTPDMLHVGILPAHDTWKNFFADLDLIVIDEVHTYRGVLGAHVAQVLRRLLRIADHYGARPRIIACSATVGKPAHFIRELTGRDATVVSADGSPNPAKLVAFVEPEASTYTTAAQLFRRCVHHGLRTIAFCQARRVTELMHMWISESDPEIAVRISSYRSGFLPEERRKIEERLFSGELAGVITTSALEMGIDVGGLDVCLLVGYPGSILSTRQRAGRVGRGREGLIILVPQQDALDRFLLAHPRALIERPCEDAVVDPTNSDILAAHLPCAAAEIPIRHDEGWLGEPAARRALDLAHESGRLLESARGGESFAARRHPAREVSLRSVGDSFSIRKPGPDGPRSVGTIGGSRVHAECHPGAIYLHRARPYVVETLDLEKNEVVVRGPLRVDHYTRALGEKETEILEVKRARPIGNALVKLGRLKVTSRITSYEKRRIQGQDLLGRYPLELPETTFETEGLWIELAPEIEDAVAAEGRHFMGGIHGLEHAALALFPLFALCDRFDVAGISIPRHPQVRGPAVFLYDSFPGGIGISRSIFDRAEDLFDLVAMMVGDCGCENGCPSCIHSPRCGAGNRPLDKAAVRQVVNLILAREALPEVRVEPDDLPLLPPPGVLARAEEEPGALVFDLETQRAASEVGGWNNTHLMRVAVGVVYDAGTGTFETYTEDTVDALIERLFSAPCVIGFNSRRFDYGVLSGYTARDFSEVKTFDLLEDIHRLLGYRISLNHLGEHTLDRGKTGDGLQSLEWFRNGEIDKVEDYCRADVELTRDLVEFAAREGYVVFEQKKTGQRVRLPVKWDPETLAEVAGRTPPPRRLH